MIVNEKHTLKIFNSYGKLILQTRLPNELTMNLSTKYQKFSSGGIAEGLKTVLSTLGLSLTFKWMDLQYWESSEPLSFSIPLYLIAYENAYKEVYLPAMKLWGLSIPRAGPGGSIIPPGVDVLTLIQNQFKKVNDAIFRGFDKDKDLPVVETSATDTVTRTPVTRTQISNEFAEAAYRTIDQLNVFSWARKLRDGLFDPNNLTDSVFGRTITIEFGNFLKFREMIITPQIEIAWGGGSKSSMMALNAQGIPLNAYINLSVRGSKIYTRHAYTGGDNRSDSYSYEELIDFTREKQGLSKIPRPRRNIPITEAEEDIPKGSVAESIKKTSSSVGAGLVDAGNDALSKFKK